MEENQHNHPDNTSTILLVVIIVILLAAGAVFFLWGRFGGGESAKPEQPSIDVQIPLPEDGATPK